MTRLLHIDTRTLIITRYENKIPTHRVKWIGEAIEPEDISMFLISPDTFIEEFKE